MQYVQRYKFAVHFYLPFHKLSLKFRVIVVLKLEVLRTDCMMVGNPKQYPSGKLYNKREELDTESVSTESVSSNAKLNCEAYSAGQHLMESLTRRGIVTALQQPVMQVVDVSLMRSKLKKFERYHLILSDTVHTQDAMLAPDLNHLVENIFSSRVPSSASLSLFAILPRVPGVNHSLFSPKWILVQERLVEVLGPFITLLVEIFLFVEVHVLIYNVAT